MDDSLASKILQLPLHCLDVEYPNKLGQAIGSESDLKTPKQLRPIFYGCFDWHSSVHGYWSMIELLKAYPDLNGAEGALALLKRNITKENIAVEQQFFEDVNNLNFERTYGWAWYFKLQEALLTWDNPDAKRWNKDFEPMTTLLAQKLKSYLPKLVYPIRHGKHENTAFGLSLILDYAETAGDNELAQLIVEHAKRLYENDVNCDMNYEPSGSDFLSPCLEEAYLMSKILQKEEYESWLKKFMPALFQPDYHLEAGVVKDRSDGQLVHLDGLNYSRAACLYGLAHSISGLEHLRKVADLHINASLPNLSHEDDYMGSHWLGTFALYALSKQ